MLTAEILKADLAKLDTGLKVVGKFYSNETLVIVQDVIEYAENDTQILEALAEALNFVSGFIAQKRAAAAIAKAAAPVALPTP
jgi:hypothetical protein